MLVINGFIINYYNYLNNYKACFYFLYQINVILNLYIVNFVVKMFKAGIVDFFNFIYFVA